MKKTILLNIHEILFCRCLCISVPLVGLLLVGCTSLQKQSSNLNTKYVRNTWYEDYRPTDDFMILDGEWNVVSVIGDRKDLWKRPDLEGEAIELPEIEKSRFRERVVPQSKDIMLNWYNREFVLNEVMIQALAAGKEIFLHIGGVSWLWSAWLNGNLIVDACYDVFNSRQVNITSILESDGVNTLVIAATDNHGLAENLRHARLFEPEVSVDSDGDFVAPAPETVSDPIVWGEIELWARPVSRIEDVFIRPDFRNKKLDIDLEITAQIPLLIDIRIVDTKGSAANIIFIPQKVDAPIQNYRLRISSSWENPRLWDPEDPFLYFAEVELRNQSTEEIIDRRNVRFGFRELWIEDGDLIMNGKRLFLARHSTITAHEHSMRSYQGPINNGQSVREEMTEMVKKWKDLNTINSLRFHRCAYIRPGAFATYADELGLMLIPESGYCMGERFAVDNPLFWKNCDDYLKAWVKSGRNHPSIVMWSLSNEFLWCGAQMVNPESHEMLYKQEKLVKSLDPTRFIGWDGDWDLPARDQVGPGKSETINIHYPRESCEYWYPTECWDFSTASMENPVPVRGFTRKFTWQLGNKPIVAGEYSWNQRYYFEGPENMTKYDGDRAYNWKYWLSGKPARKVVKWQTDAWRVQRFAGLNPWIHRSKSYYTLMPLETIVLREVPTVYYGGEKINLEAYLLNDTQRDRDYVVQWKLSSGNEVYFRGKKGFNLTGGNMVKFDLELSFPEVTSPKDLILQVSVERDKKTRNSEEYTVRIRPHNKIEWPEGTVLFDPGKKTTDLLAKIGITPKFIDLIADGLSASAIVLGQNAYTENFNDKDMKNLNSYVSQGGTVLTMGEEKWPERGFGINTVFQEARSNHAWVRSEGHPVLKGISDLDLGFWGGDHWVNQHVLLKPDRGTGTAWRTLIDVGSRQGLEGAVLVELFSGKGRFLHNLLDLSKAAEEPGALALLQNLLDNINEKVEKRNPVSIMVGEDHPVVVQLKQSYIRIQPWDMNQTDVPLFVSAGNTETDPKKIATWVKKGGIVWLLDLDDKNVVRWDDVVSGGIDIHASNSYDGALIVENDPLLWGISNEEFFTCEGVWSSSPGPDSPYPRGRGMSKLASLGNFSIEAGRNSKLLTDPAYLVRVNDGEGIWLLSSLDFEEGMLKMKKKTGRLLQALFTNFSLESNENMIRDVVDLTPILLSNHANRGFQDDVTGDGIGGWFDQGFSIDLHFFPQNISGYDLANLPMPAPSEEAWPVHLTLAGIDFHMIDPRKNNGKSCIVLSPGEKTPAGLIKGDLPAQISGLVVNRKFEYLYSLHASGFVEGQADKTVLWRYILHYRDGTIAEIPIRLNEETSDWLEPRELPSATIGWLGPSLTVRPVGLYIARLTNPEPIKEVVSLDIISTEVGSISGIIALTTGKILN
jgi:hypothetical protein